jgi:formate--tetrahydrofolate ligase
VLTDIEIARKATLAPIAEVAERMGLSAADLMFYGDDKAKIRPSALKSPHRRALAIRTPRDPRERGACP